MIEKVMLPIEVAGAIEKLRGEGFTDFGIIQGMSTGKGLFNTLNQWSYINNCRNTDKLLSAIINGYEIEQDEVGVSKLSTSDIYLGLIALACQDEKNSWFLKGAADAILNESNQVWILWQELKSAREQNYEPSETTEDPDGLKNELPLVESAGEKETSSSECQSKRDGNSDIEEFIGGINVDDALLGKIVERVERFLLKRQSTNEFQEGK
ncbi:hypothetical protein [Sporosarcina sp. FSL K6-3457]|uniref:hypothetical protein n=1 Tax=Sporosarcina sp. FSL K6-3457 TaxID=2978204 RepID=UPI0030F65A40